MLHFKIFLQVSWQSSVNTPIQISLRAVNADVCFDKDPSLGKIYSRTTFCVGGKSIEPCRGDSGGGFFIHFQGHWTLRGIASGGRMNSAECNADRFSLFTTLIDFFDWIKNIVDQ